MRKDGFTQKNRQILARRVGYRCSNPNCRILTSGPSDSITGTVDVGIAAHITAASKGGKRYDPNISSNERKSPENGIWLCQIHAKQIDDSPERFTVELLREWRRISEDAARLEIEYLDKEQPSRLAADIEALKIYAEAFNRSAFKDFFEQEMSMTAYDRAIRDTIILLSTGILKDRDGNILKQTKGRLALDNRIWSEKIGVVIDLLNAMVRRFSVAINTGGIDIYGYGREVQTYCIKDQSLIGWMDSTRVEACNIVCDVLAEAGLDPLHHKGFRNYKFR